MKQKVRVAHDLKDFDEGEQIILTLKDQNLIKGENINEDEEQLENIELREKGQADFNQYLRENIKKLAHAETSHLQYKLEGKNDKVLLPHYDEIKYHKEGFHLEKTDEEMVAPKTVSKEIEHQKELLSLMTKQNKLASEYDTTEKKTIKARKTDKNKSVKQLMSFLEETAIEEVDDRDSMKRKAQQLLDDLDQVKKRKNFDKAIEKAMINNKSIQDKAREVEDYELELALRRRKKEKTINTEEQVMKLLNETVERNPVDRNTVQVELDTLNVNRLKEGIQPRQNQSKQFTLKDAREGYTSVLNISLPSERRNVVEAIKQEQLPQRFEDIPEEQLERMKEEIAFMHPEDLGVGLSGVLRYIRQTGLNSQEELVGRSLDHKPKQQSDSEDRIKLQYLDGHGRPMTPKEAFRYMCWIFHGEGPGKNKIEKRKMKELVNQKIRIMQSGDSTMMRLLNEHQKRTGEAHMVFKQQKK